MATKAHKGRTAALYIGVSTGTAPKPFSAVRNWAVRVERKIIDATNNDSSGWRELAAPATNGGGKDAGQMSWSVTAESIYDVSTGGPNFSQPYERAQHMAVLIGTGYIYYLEMRLGRDPTSTSGNGWGKLYHISSGVTAFLESVQTGGTYDAPVFYDLVIRGHGTLTFS